MKYVNICREILTIHSVQTTQTHHCVATVCVIPIAASYICLSFCSRSVCLWVSVCMYVLSTYLSVCLSVFLSVCSSMSVCLPVTHKMHTREKMYYLFLSAGCKDLATPLSCTARLTYKTAVNCEKTFLKNFMGNEKPNCGYVHFVNNCFCLFFLCFGKSSLAANGRTMMQLVK